MRPAGADNYLKWRRTIDEHLELRRMTWHEYAMFNWLCTKAHPWSGTLRTSWPTLAAQTGLSAGHVERLCRGLRRKCYVWYPNHRGARGRLVEVAIHKFPLPGDGYTDLRIRFEELPSDLQSKPPSDVLSEVPGEIAAESRTSRPGRTRTRRRTTSLRVRRADPSSTSGSFTGERTAGSGPPAMDAASSASEEWLAAEDALAEAPAALRETLELYCFKTGRDRVARADLDFLRRLDGAHTPAVIQKAISTAVARFRRRGEDLARLSLDYVWASLQHFTTRRPLARAALTSPPAAPARYPDGVTRLG